MYILDVHYDVDPKYKSNITTKKLLEFNSFTFTLFQISLFIFNIDQVFTKSQAACPTVLYIHFFHLPVYVSF